MKVKDLIGKLSEMNPEAEVFIYSELDEGDARAEFVQECGTPPYCQGDSYAREYMADHPGERVVVIHNDRWVAERPQHYFEFEEPEEDEESEDEYFND